MIVLNLESKFQMRYSLLVPVSAELCIYSTNGESNCNSRCPRNFYTYDVGISGLVNDS